ncbi:hypothetical protein ACFQ0B_70645 [Nonomuraea thailandensis]
MLLAADDPDRLDAVSRPGLGHGPDEIGVGAAEGQQPRMAQVVLELARLVVVVQQEHPDLTEPWIQELFHGASLRSGLC